MIVIRRYRLEDHAQVMDLHVAPMQAVGAYRGPGPWDDDLNDIEGVYLASGGEFLVGDGWPRGRDRRFKTLIMARDHAYAVHGVSGRGHGKEICGVGESRRELGYGAALHFSAANGSAARLYRPAATRSGRVHHSPFDCILYGS